MNSDAQNETRMDRPSSQEELGRRLSAVLDRIGTRQKASEIAERSVDQLGKYVKGAAEPPFLPLIRLCEAAGVRMEWLATGTGPMLLSETAQQRGSQSARLDAETMRSALKLLTWAFELQGASYDPARDPDLLVETYAFLDEHGGSVTPDNLVDFSRRLAEKRAQEALRGKQGGSGSVPRGSDSQPGKK
jgi:hypothetical protein